MDQVKNFAYGVIQNPPSLAGSGTSLTLNSGQGANFPTPGNAFNAVIWPGPTTFPTAQNAEIVRVTAISSDTLTIVRQQEGTAARQILQGDYIALVVTAKTITDIETSFQPISSNLTTYASKTPPSGTVVGTTDSQTLTNKTLTSPLINVGSDAQGDLYYRDGSGNFARLGAGTSGQVLATQGAGANPHWVNSASQIVVATNSSGADFTTTSSTYVDSNVSNSSVTITTTVTCNIFITITYSAQNDTNTNDINLGIGKGTNTALKQYLTRPISASISDIRTVTYLDASVPAGTYTYHQGGSTSNGTDTLHILSGSVITVIAIPA